MLYGVDSGHRFWRPTTFFGSTFLPLAQVHVVKKTALATKVGYCYVCFFIFGEVCFVFNFRVGMSLFYCYGFIYLGFLRSLALIWKDFFNTSKYFWFLLVFSSLGGMNVLRATKPANLFYLKSRGKTGFIDVMLIDRTLLVSYMWEGAHLQILNSTQYLQNQTKFMNWHLEICFFFWQFGKKMIYP